MKHWILETETETATCCPWPAQCGCRPRREALSGLDLSASGDSWEDVLLQLVASGH